MLARGALCRLAADIPKTSTHDLPRLSHLLRSSVLSRNGLSLPAARALSTAYRAALTHYRRSYATTAQKTKPTVKRPVKKAAAKKPAKKTTTRKTTRKTAKKAARKPSTKRAKSKKKAAKPKPKPRKKLTAEEKEKAKLVELKKTALRTPTTMLSVSAWNAYAADALQKVTGQPRGTAPVKMKEAAQKFQTLTPAEREHWNHVANERTAAKRAEYESWIHSFTPEQIRLANRARLTLKRYLAAGKKIYVTPKNLKPLHDDRQVKAPSTPYILFYQERRSSGDFKGIGLSEASKLISAEWKALSAGEKQKYTTQYEASKAAYQQEKEKVYGHA